MCAPLISFQMTVEVCFEEEKEERKMQFFELKRQIRRRRGTESANGKLKAKKDEKREREREREKERERERERENVVGN